MCEFADNQYFCGHRFFTLETPCGGKCEPQSATSQLIAVEFRCKCGECQWQQRQETEGSEDESDEDSEEEF
jgi:hypothetical protein